MLTVCFRADGSASIGAGHIGRCLALARAIQRRGGKAVFVSKELGGVAGSMIADSGFESRLIEAASPDWKDDAAETCRHSADADWIVVDSYALDRSWHRAARANGAKILVIDDLADRELDCDILIDPGRPDPAEYRPLSPPGCRFFCGPKYALLNREFRLSGNEDRIAEQSRKLDLMVFFGSADRRGLTETTIETLSAIPATRALRVHVVVTSSNSRRREIADACRMAENLIVHEDVRDMAAFQSGMDLAIGAGGVSLWERCCAGLPGIGVCLNENQRAGIDAAVAAGAVVPMEPEQLESPAALEKNLRVLLENPGRRAEMKESGKRLVDGYGTDRVAAMMGRLTLRPATQDDCRRVWEMANDPDVRKMAFNTDTIAWADHIAWFEAKTATPGSMLLIAENEAAPVGKILFDWKPTDGHAEIDISVVRERRNAGLGLEILLKGIEIYRRRHEGRSITASVKTANTASLGLFETAGFERRAPAGAEEAVQLILRN